MEINIKTLLVVTFVFMSTVGAAFADDDCSYLGCSWNKPTQQQTKENSKDYERPVTPDEDSTKTGQNRQEGSNIITKSDK